MTLKEKVESKQKLIEQLQEELATLEMELNSSTINKVLEEIKEQNWYLTNGFDCLKITYKNDSFHKFVTVDLQLYPHGTFNIESDVELSCCDGHISIYFKVPWNSYTYKRDQLEKIFNFVKLHNLKVSLDSLDAEILTCETALNDAKKDKELVLEVIRKINSKG